MKVIQKIKTWLSFNKHYVFTILKFYVLGLDSFSIFVFAMTIFLSLMKQNIFLVSGLILILVPFIINIVKRIILFNNNKNNLFKDYLKTVPAIILTLFLLIGNFMNGSLELVSIIDFSFISLVIGFYHFLNYKEKKELNSITNYAQLRKSLPLDSEEISLFLSKEFAQKKIHH